MCEDPLAEVFIFSQDNPRWYTREKNYLFIPYTTI